MVALSAAAVIEDGLAAVLVTDRAQPVRDLTDRRIPVDLFEGPVRASAQRCGHATGPPILIGVQLQRLVAGVALRRRVALVTADLVEGVPVLADEDLDAAVALAQDARTRPPTGRSRRTRAAHLPTSIDCGPAKGIRYPSEFAYETH